MNDTINLSASNFTQVVGSGDGGFGGVTRETKEYTIDTDCQKFCKMVGQCLIDIEKMFEIPIITSNQALVWYCLNKSPQIDKDDIKKIEGYGVLFKKNIWYI